MKIIENGLYLLAEDIEGDDNNEHLLCFWHPFAYQIEDLGKLHEDEFDALF